ncbi:hypothetical protein [Nocardia nepalensis]|uniref:hypothetical protein n=1 Tax=Nocardia nepalensis TaxID=3375448 RepID=UPI003B67F47D
MNAVIPPGPDDLRQPGHAEGAIFGDCLTDPGELGTNDAIHAMSVHHSCPPQCLPLGRAMDTLSVEFVSTAMPSPDLLTGGGSAQQSATEAQPSVEIDEQDQILADTIRSHQRLARPRRADNLAGPHAIHTNSATNE